MAFRLAVVLAAIACALFWAGPPAPAAAQSTETGVSGVTVGGNPGYQIGDTDWVAGVSAATTQATVVVTPVDDDATVRFAASDADSSTAGHQVNLSAGYNYFEFTVVAENGTHSVEYGLPIYRTIDGVFGFRFDDSLSGTYEAGHQVLESGMWSDGETVWAVSAFFDKLFAYQLDGGAYDSDKDFNTLRAAGNDRPRGIWSDRVTMWVADSGDDKLYAYRMSDRSRIPSRDIETLAEAGNLDPEGLWSDGRTIWVADSGDDKLYAYWLADGARRPAGDFNTLRAAGNDRPRGIWSDRVTMWVADLVDDKIYAYRMSDRARDSDKDFNRVDDLQESAAAIWSDGAPMWVADAGGLTLAYNLTVPGDLDLGSITFNGAAVSGVSADRLSYTLSETVPLTADVTIAATASATGSSVDFSYPDVISGTTGHQIALDEGDNLIQLYVRGLATYRTYELNVTGGDAPRGETSKARIQVDEDDDGAVHQFRGEIQEVEDGRDFDWINVTLEADQLYAIILKGGRYGDTDRTLHAPASGVLSMGMLHDGTDALGVAVSSGIDGRARALFKPTTAGDYQVVVAGALADQTGTYDLRVRPYEDDHYPNGIETSSTISFPTDSSLTHYPSAAVTGRINYEFDDDWFQASGLAPGRSYGIEARHGVGDEPRTGRRYLFIQVYDEEGDKVEVEQDLNRYIFTPQSAQDYYIRVYSHRQDRSRYTLYLHPTLFLSGNLLVGDSVSVDPTDIYDPDGTSRVTRNDSWRYTWRRTNASGNVELIRGARGRSYQLTDDDADHTITARVCYKAGGSYRVYDCRYSYRTYGRPQLVRGALTVPSSWDRVPSGLDAGDQFRLLMVSKGLRTARETDIAVYNTWAQGQVTSGHEDIQEYASHFAVVGSTSAISARVNTDTEFTDDDQGIPIYWLGGRKAADDYADFYDGSWDWSNPVTLSDGTSKRFNNISNVWTGSNQSGYERTVDDVHYGLGNATVRAGRPATSTDGKPLDSINAVQSIRASMYILSHPFEVGEATSMEQGGNQPASGRPVISGAHNVGDTVTADVTGIADADGLTGVAFSYQWLSGDREVSGETNASYTLAGADFGQAVSVRVTFSDDAGNEETLTSEGIYPIMTATENTPATGQPTISGTPLVDQTLAAGVTEIADADGLEDVSYAYQWLADNAAITGATAATYTLTSGEQGKTVNVAVTFTDDAGNAESLTSAATATIAPLPLTGFSLVDTSDQSVAATLAGGDRIVLDDPANGSYGIRADVAANAVLESVLLELTGATTVDRTENIPPYSLHGDDGDNLNGRALPPGSYTLRATAYLEDDLGGDAIQVLEVSFNIVKANTPATGRPAITGAVRVGETLYADVAGVSDADGLDNVSYAYRWRADNAVITGATGSSLELASDQEGKAIKVTVSFTDDAGNSEALTSAATTETAAARPAVPTSPPPAPQNLTYAVNDDGHVVLSWTAPDDDTVTGYRIMRRRPRQNENTLLVYVSDTGNTSATYTDEAIEAGELYVYRVRAVNAAGVGPQSNYVNVEP